MKLLTPTSDRHNIRSLSIAFKQNARMKVLTGQEQPDARILDMIMSYCYHLAKRLNGYYQTSNDSTILLFYRNSTFKKSLSDWLRYLRMALIVIGPSRIMATYTREKRVKSRRLSLAKKFRDQDFIYVWFLAQKDGNHSYKGLVESSNHIKNLSKRSRLPVYMETTDSRLLKMYERAGFVFHDVLEDADSEIKVWFGRYNRA